ncbi:MAG: energy-coupling factor ABC transporter ATP-binding protein [Fusobacteriaceae bacterium]
MVTQINIEKLFFSYENKTSEFILKNINLNVKKGEFLAIIGKSGSGKSTLLKHLNGILKSDIGKVEILDTVINSKSKNLNSLRAKVGVVFQFSDEQLFSETVKDELLFAPSKFNMPLLEQEKALKKIQNIFNISDSMLKKNSLELSGGEKKKISIAGMAIYSPNILVLDEPTIGLDAQSKDALLKCLKVLNDLGTTIIIVSHDLNSIWECVNRVVFMNNGEINFDGNKLEFLNFSKDIDKKMKFLPNYIEILEKNNFNIDEEINLNSKVDSLNFLLKEFRRREKNER